MNCSQPLKFPKRGDEYWKFTNPEKFLGHLEPINFKAMGSHKPSASGALELFPEFENNVVTISTASAVSSDFSFSKYQGVQIQTLEVLKNTKPKWFTSISGKLEASLQKPIERPFAKHCIQNSSLGFGLCVEGRIVDPIVIDYQDGVRDSHENVYNVIKVEENASLTLIEVGNPWKQSTHVTEINIADGGKLSHFRILLGNENSTTLTHQYGQIAKDASLLSFTYTVEGNVTRNEYIFKLSGDNGNAFVSGIYSGTEDKHHDDTVFINHQALHCKSRQVFKKVLRDKSTGVFQGKILVDPGAQKTDGYQKSQALLLSEKSQFLVKPELEIYADDVSCSHGSTCGSIDPEALYYLRSRGIPKNQAIGLLAEGFLAEVFEEFNDEYITGVLRDLLTKSF